MILYDYFRSSASYRVRIALNLKGISYQQQSVNLVAGEQRGAEHARRNPQGFVPALELDDGTILTQSIAICEYLEETYPTPALLPADKTLRARVRAMVNLIAADIHPLNNLRILKYLEAGFDADQLAKDNWYRHWVMEGFGALETLLADASGNYCLGESPTLADICLVPQVFNAVRFNCDLSGFPKIQQVDAHCRLLPAFEKAHPQIQPDAS